MHTLYPSLSHSRKKSTWLQITWNRCSENCENHYKWELSESHIEFWEGSSIHKPATWHILNDRRETTEKTTNPSIEPLHSVFIDMRPEQKSICGFVTSIHRNTKNLSIYACMINQIHDIRAYSKMRRLLLTSPNHLQAFNIPTRSNHFTFLTYTIFTLITSTLQNW